MSPEQIAKARALCEAAACRRISLDPGYWIWLALIFAVALEK